MKANEEEFKLGETYKFDVVVDNNGRKFAGKLRLSAEKCTLRVSGETSEGREVDLGWQDLEVLTCRAFRMSFILLNLKIKNTFNGTLERQPRHIGMFEINYEIGYVISSRSSSTRHSVFEGFELSSSLFDLWVGETTIQHKIISKFHSRTLFSDNEVIPHEFETYIDGLGIAIFGYETSTHFSVQEFSSGVHFPPRFTVLFDGELTGPETIEIFNKIRNFISVIFGTKISFEKIRFLSSQSTGFDHPTLYFSESKALRGEQDIVMFPLGCNSVRNDLGLPEFPVESINSYFNSPKEVRTYFKKYVKYRDLENPEEKFLGYFRLLEKLTFQKASFVDDIKLETLLKRADNFIARHFDDKASTKALLKQVRRVNQSKLNTASCIINFMKDIPSEISEKWIFGKSDIDAICKLRNDLIHANEIEPDESDIEIRAKFIEVLLLFSLLNAVGIPPVIVASIVPRMRSYDWIKKRPELKFIKMTTTENGETN